MTTDWKQDEWKGCYPSSWKGMIVPEAMAHPAKFSSKLIRRIYEHMRAEGWVKTGDRVIDPFGGVALGALDAMRLGLEWLGMELEVKFVDLGNHNISNWELKFGKSMPNWGSARLLQGDSRKMLEKLGRGRAALSSPPYAESINQGDGANDGEARIERKARAGIDVSKPKNNGGPNSVLNTAQVYGATPGQLGTMKDDGDSRAAAMISSPPFGESLAREGVDADSRRQLAREQGLSNSEHVSPIDMGRIGARNQEYGSTPGQLGGMDTGNFASAVMKSPPFGEAQTGSGIAKGVRGENDYPMEMTGGLARTKKAANSSKGFGYQNQGGDPANLSSMNTENFAEAMRSSPPYAETEITGQRNFKSRSNPDGNGANEIREGDKGYQALVSSPPFLQSEGGTGAQGGVIDERLMARHAAGNSAAEGYGGAEGQLGNMTGDFARVAMKSPPYEGDVVKARSSHMEVARTQAKGMKRTPGMTGDLLAQEKYGETEGQIGNDSGSDFWTAARQIVEQVYLALAPGGHAVWVVKNYVKKKEMVPFSDQWRQLCEAVGFETLHEHRALLVHATSLTLDGREVHKESKSFFRRLAEKKGSPRIDWETVYCMVKR